MIARLLARAGPAAPVLFFFCPKNYLPADFFTFLAPGKKWRAQWLIKGNRLLERAISRASRDLVRLNTRI